MALVLTVSLELGGQPIHGKLVKNLIGSNSFWAQPHRLLKTEM
jgi:hypothetical protein